MLGAEDPECVDPTVEPGGAGDAAAGIMKPNEKHPFAALLKARMTQVIHFQVAPPND